MYFQAENVKTYNPFAPPALPVTRDEADPIAIAEDGWANRYFGI